MRVLRTILGVVVSLKAYVMASGPVSQLITGRKPRRFEGPFGIHYWCDRPLTKDEITEVFDL